MTMAYGGRRRLRWTWIVAAILALVLIITTTAVRGDVACNVCNGLQVKCLGKASVISCNSYSSKPHIVKCPTGTYCNVNRLPWCSKDHKPLCRY